MLLVGNGLAPGPAHVSFQALTRAFPLPGPENSRGGRAACCSLRWNHFWAAFPTLLPHTPWVGGLLAQGNPSMFLLQYSVHSLWLVVSPTLHDQDPDL